MFSQCVLHQYFFIDFRVDIGNGTIMVLAEGNFVEAEKNRQKNCVI